MSNKSEIKTYLIWSTIDNVPSLELFRILWERVSDFGLWSCFGFALPTHSFPKRVSETVNFQKRVSEMGSWLSRGFPRSLGGSPVSLRFFPALSRFRCFCFPFRNRVSDLRLSETISRHYFPKRVSETYKT